jgi:hypothetical protein
MSLRNLERVKANKSYSCLYICWLYVTHISCIVWMVQFLLQGQISCWIGVGQHIKWWRPPKEPAAECEQSLIQVKNTSSRSWVPLVEELVLLIFDA